MFNVYGEFPQFTYSLHDTIEELDTVSGERKRSLAQFLRTQAGYRGSDDKVISTYRKEISVNLN